MASRSERFFSSRRISPCIDALEESAPAVVDGLVELRGPVAFGLVDAGAEESGGAGGVEFDEEVEDGLGLAATDGEHAVRGDGLHRLAVVVVHLELALLVFFLAFGLGGFAGDDDALVEEELADGFAEFGGLGDGFGHDVAGTFEGVPEC